MGLLEVLSSCGFDLDCNACMVRHRAKRPECDFTELVRKGWFEPYQCWQFRPRFHAYDFVVSFIGDGGGRARFLGVYERFGNEVVAGEDVPVDVPWTWIHKGPFNHYDLRGKAGYDSLKNRLVIEWSSERSWVQKLKNNNVLDLPRAR